MIQIFYFASIREQLDCSTEEISLTDNIRTISELKHFLSARGDRWHDIFDASNQGVLFSINQEIARSHQAISDGDEIAFFPQVTGG